jgi:hypothetical protein
MNMIPSILQPLGAVVVEQQEVAMQEDATVTEPPSSDGSSSTSSAFIDRMHHRMNMIPSILQPLGAVVVE